MAAEHDLDMIAAGLRRDTADARQHGDAVLQSLADALPPELARVRRSGGLVRKAKVTAVEVSLGDRRYVLRAAATGLVSSVCHESGGIVLSRTAIEFDAWVRELLSALANAADRTAAAARLPCADSPLAAPATSDRRRRDNRRP